MNISKEEIEKLITPIFNKEKIELVKVEYKTGKENFLRIFIDKPEGITIDDCENISKKIELILDAYPDLIKGHYYLEVSSPGLDRPLTTEKDFLRYRGETVKVKLFSPFQEQKVFSGEIIDCQDKKLILTLKNKKQIEIPLENIALAKLEIEIK